MNPILMTVCALAVLSPFQALCAAEQSSDQPSAAALPTAAPGFEELMAESGMQLKTPKGFHDVVLHANPLFMYDKAVSNEDSTLEIRYAVRPLGRIQIDYEDPHSSAPDPNHMFPVMFQSMVTLLSDGRHSPTREYPRTQATEKFNADWAAAAVFDISERFETNHKMALVIALHKNQLADAYAVFLFDDYEQAKPLLDQTLEALRFAPEPAEEAPSGG